MAGETNLFVVGNLTADPELRYTSGGVAVANMTIASSPRVFDRKTDTWADGPTMFMRATVWREYAEHVAATLHKGNAVIAYGRLSQKGWETPEGEKRSSYELDVDEIGPSLRFMTAELTRASAASDSVDRRVAEAVKVG